MTFICSFVVILILPYYLNDAQYSNYALVSSMINFFIPIATFGLIPFIIRNYNNSEHRGFNLRYVAIAVFTFGVLSSLLIYGLISIVVVNDELGEYKYLIPVVFILSALSTVASGYYRASNKPKKYFHVIAGQKIILCVGVIFIFYFIEEFRSAYVFFLITALSICLSLALTKLDIFPTLENKEKEVVSIFYGLKYCAPIAISNVLLMTIPFYERIFITNYLTSIQFSQYVFNFELASKITAIILLLLKVIIWPKIAIGSPKEEIKKYYYITKRLFFIVVLFAILSIFVSKFIYEDIMLVIYSDNRVSNVTLFIAAMLFSTFVILLYIVNLGFLLTGNTNVMMLVYVLILLSHISLLYYMMPLYGLNGVVYSIILSQFLGLIFSLCLSRTFLIKYEKAL